jgi:hypothetical protein
MRKTGFFISAGTLLLLFASNLFSQDLIITNNNDSIRCKIKGIKGNDMLYTYPGQSGTPAGKVSLGQMKYYQYNFYKVPRSKTEVRGLTKGRIGIEAGYSRRTASTVDGIPPSLTDYVESLKSGYTYGLDFMYFFNDFLGIGFKASQFKTGKKQADRLSYSDDISIGFIGPEFCTRLPSRTNLSALLVAISIGYSGYRDNAFNYAPLTIKGNTVGVGMDLGYDIGLSKNWAVSFQLSTEVGMLHEIDIKQGYQTLHIDLEKGNYESLTRVDFSVGLHCRF